jgi:hypothetical protein
MTKRAPSKRRRDVLLVDEQLYLQMQAIHEQLYDARALLVKMREVVRNVEATSARRAEERLRIERRFSILIVLVDVALDEIRSYCGFVGQDQAVE